MQSCIYKKECPVTDGNDFPATPNEGCPTLAQESPRATPNDEDTVKEKASELKSSTVDSNCKDNRKRDSTTPSSVAPCSPSTASTHTILGERVSPVSTRTVEGDDASLASSDTVSGVEIASDAVIGTVSQNEEDLVVEIVRHLRQLDDFTTIPPSAPFPVHAPYAQLDFLMANRRPEWGGHQNPL